MSNSNLKNIVVLKNIPSNLIDEAIIVLKSKKTAKKLELIEKNSAISFVRKTNNNNDYIIKEAESIVSNYINKIEKNKSIKLTDNNIEAKYRKIKVYSIFISVLLLLCMVRIIF